jgi:hypothetical protein
MFKNSVGRPPEETLTAVSLLHPNRLAIHKQLNRRTIRINFHQIRFATIAPTHRPREIALDQPFLIHARNSVRHADFGPNVRIVIRFAPRFPGCSNSSKRRAPGGSCALMIGRRCRTAPATTAVDVDFKNELTNTIARNINLVR